MFELFFYSLSFLFISMKIFYLMKVDFEFANFSSWQPSPLWYYKDFLQISNIHNNHDDQSKIVEKIPIDGQIANSWKKVSIFSYDMITPKTQFSEPLFSEILKGIPENQIRIYHPTHVKCRLLISSIFYGMNFWHFLKMLEFNL